MIIDLFLDSVDRDLFKRINTLTNTTSDMTSSGELEINWRGIYQDLGPWGPSLASKKEPSLFKTFTVHGPGDALFEWQTAICLRAEMFGGLLYTPATNRVYRLDKEAFEALSILWVGKATSYLELKKFPLETIRELFQQLQTHELLLRIMPIPIKEKELTHRLMAKL